VIKLKQFGEYSSQAKNNQFEAALRIFFHHQTNFVEREKKGSKVVSNYASRT
jgi:plasmid replication initiation protein